MATREQLVRARQWLRECRGGQVRVFARALADFLQSRGIAPEEIGSTSEEIVYLLQAAHLAWVRHYLRLCRSGRALSVKELRRHIDLSGLSFERLGISERELATFERFAKVWLAKFCLQNCRWSVFGDLVLLQELIK